jgi:hypothetical protein
MIKYRQAEEATILKSYDKIFYLSFAINTYLNLKNAQCFPW